jgi:hypothetical protein
MSAEVAHSLCASTTRSRSYFLSCPLVPHSLKVPAWMSFATLAVVSRRLTPQYLSILSVHTYFSLFPLCSQSYQTVLRTIPQEHLDTFVSVSFAQVGVTLWHRIKSLFIKQHASRTREQQESYYFLMLLACICSHVIQTIFSVNPVLTYSW